MTRRPLTSLRIFGLYLVAGMVWLLPLSANPGGILFWRGGEFSDLLISHWPNAIFIRRALETWHQLPLWNPMILGGTPFAADPLAGIWYLPNGLTALAPAPWAFNLLLWLHLAWAGLGTFYLMRRAGIGRPAALLSGLAFSGTPKLIGHAGLGHISLVFAVSWTPWALDRAWAAAEALARKGEASRRLAALAGAVLGLVFLIDPRWFPPLTLLALAVGLWRLGRSRLRHRERLGGGLGAGVLAAGFAAGVMASLALPLWEHLALSTRAALEPSQQGHYALPLPRLLGLLAADFGAWPEWQVYPGVILIALGLVALWSGRPGARFWSGVAFAGWMISLGDQLPLFPILRAIVPGFSFLRVPARVLFCSGMAMAVLAGLGLHQMLRGFDRRTKRRIRLSLFGMLMLEASLAGASLLADRGTRVEDRFAGALPYLLAAALVGLAWIWTEAGARFSRRELVLGWALLLVVDLGLADLSLVEVRPVIGMKDASVEAIAARLSGSPPMRVFSPSYSLPQPAAASAGLELVDGIHPLQLSRYRSYMAEATGFVRDGYSVTLPPYPEGQPSIPWDVRPGSIPLGLLNVGYLVSAYPIQALGWNFEGKEGGSYIYRNEDLRPRAWIQSQESAAGWRRAERMSWSPNAISLTAQGPGLLVLSEIDYPGWQVEVNGQRRTIQTAYGLFRAVELPAGANEVVFRFVPGMALLGGALTLATVFTLAFLWIKP